MAEISVFLRKKVVAAAIVDDVDFVRLAYFRWNLHQGYPVCKFLRPNGGWSSVQMGRYILGLEYGDGREVDHINRNPLDNRRENLRVVSIAENAQNRKHKGGSSKHRGVTWHSQANKWQAAVKLKGKSNYLGLFDSESDAARVAADFIKKNLPFAQDEGSA